MGPWQCTGTGGKEHRPKGKEETPDSKKNRKQGHTQRNEYGLPENAKQFNRVMEHCTKYFSAKQKAGQKESTCKKMQQGLGCRDHANNPKAQQACSFLLQTQDAN
jgi:hypothetical protein